MKRLFALLIILITIVGGVSAEDAYAYNFPFTLLLRRNGTDSVWFTKNKGDTVTNKISLHIFPIISASNPTTSSVTSTVYLYWLKQSSNKVNIKITFVGNESWVESESSPSTFMLWCASIENQGATKTAANSEDNGINFDVVITDNNNAAVGSLSFNTAEARLTKATDAQRSITFNPAETKSGSAELAYASPLAIAMTINPASKDTDGSIVGHWGVDIQFVGYIKATIIAAT